ncbi:hypothetical protein TRVA0_062S00408 [Trichomonascus vanleenenianus]|uniref:phosphate-sensing transcription factor PHO4 n=1 Tax=Trichomonascus vanleenenianus TaxID=2268995 RepID=UPI003ECAF8DC
MSREHGDRLGAGEDQDMMMMSEGYQFEQLHTASAELDSMLSDFLHDSRGHDFADGFNGTHQPQPQHHQHHHQQQQGLPAGFSEHSSHSSSRNEDRGGFGDPMDISAGFRPPSTHQENLFDSPNMSVKDYTPLLSPMVEPGSEPTHFTNPTGEFEIPGTFYDERTAMRSISANNTPMLLPDSPSIAVVAGGGSMPPPQSRKGKPVTPASLMNLRSNSTGSRPSEIAKPSEERLQNAIRATNNSLKSQSQSVIQKRRSSTTPSSSPYMNSAIRPKPSGLSRISPVIKPKFSPQISPKIAPSDSKNSDYEALLASKSNYQTIVEGKHRQLGLSYPEQLSADLTLKKTSHKLAEQGRRNRINVALSELGKLVEPCREDGQINSKATTVETAIRYIKQLEEDLAEAKAKLAKYEEEKDS